jgi:hypothetical protein
LFLWSSDEDLSGPDGFSIKLDVSFNMLASSDAERWTGINIFAHLNPTMFSASLHISCSGTAGMTQPFSGYTPDLSMELFVFSGRLAERIRP